MFFKRTLWTNSILFYLWYWNREQRNLTGIDYGNGGRMTTLVCYNIYILPLCSYFIMVGNRTRLVRSPSAGLFVWLRSYPPLTATAVPYSPPFCFSPPLSPSVCSGQRAATPVYTQKQIREQIPLVISMLSSQLLQKWWELLQNRLLALELYLSVVSENLQTWLMGKQVSKSHSSLFCSTTSCGAFFELF